MQRSKIKTILTTGLIICFFSGCTTVLKKEDIYLEARRIKAELAEKQIEIASIKDEQPPNAIANLPIPILESPIKTPPPLPLPVNNILSHPEQLIYQAKFLGLAIGHFTISNKGKTIIHDRPAYRFEIEVKTASFFSLLFKPKDRYVSYMDAEKFIVLRHEEYIKAGTILESSTDFDHQQHIAHYKNHINHKEENVAIPDKIFDIISGAYYLRTIPLAAGDTQEVALYADEKVYNFVGLIHSQTSITLPSQAAQNAFLFKPYVFLDGKPITMISAEVFFATDAIKTPLRAFLKTPLGTVIVTLDTK